MFKKKKKIEPKVLEIPKEYEDRIITLSLRIRKVSRETCIEDAIKVRRDLWEIFECIHPEVTKGLWDYEIPVFPSQSIKLIQREV